LRPWGSEPIAAFLLGVPTTLPQQCVDGFLKGLFQLADEFKVTLAGGDISQSLQGVLADTVVVGSARKARPSCVQGTVRGPDLRDRRLGGSAAALNLLYSRPRKKLMPRDFVRHFFP